MQIILILLLVLNLVWSALLHFEPTHTTVLNYLYNMSYGLNFALASSISFSYFRRCQIHRPIHVVGGLGSLSFSIAQLIWVYYNLILKTPIPYPSIADLFWILYYPFMIVGSILVMHEIKIKLTWSVILETSVIFTLIFFIIYSFISTGSTQESLPLLTQALNLSYPIFDSLLIAMMITAIHSQLGHLQPLLLYFIFAFTALAFGDTLFAYQTTFETYWNGNVVDATYALAGFLFAMGIHSLHDLLHNPSLTATASSNT